jgi:hypothetical protein
MHYLDITFLHTDTLISIQNTDHLSKNQGVLSTNIQLISTSIKTVDSAPIIENPLNKPICQELF